jgi:uncharacterized membrane protein YwzB
VVLLGKPGFYLFIVILFIFESLWIAFSALYPQAFDENFHFGLIKTYSHYWLPFLTKQPPNANAYGAVARDPSYLYHYLMSFPYRFISLFIHGQTGQVISLRVIDIGLFLIGLHLFRKVLLRAGLSKSLANVSLLILILIPIVPQLAAQISYDDLLFALVAWICLQAFNITDEIKKHKLSSTNLIVLIITMLLTGITKYASLPISAAVVIYLIWLLHRQYKPNYKKVWLDFKKDFSKHSLKIKVLLIAGLVISFGMFLERDGVNLVMYHKIEPNCAKVLSVKQCEPYSAWYATYARHEDLVAGKTKLTYNLFTYTTQWFHWMWYRLFFAVNGPKSNFANYSPLPVPSIVAIGVAALGGLALVFWRKLVFRDNPYAVLLLLVVLIYCFTLFVQGYATYNYTAVLENMNGRYLIPILLPLAGVLGLALSRGLHKWKYSKALITLVVILLFFEGGGLLTFILRSDNTWYWDNHTVQKVNNEARKVVKHVVLHGSKLD